MGLYGRGAPCYNTGIKFWELVSVNKLRNALCRFMYGRNGVDALGWALLGLELLLSTAGALVRTQAVSATLYFVSMVAMFVLLLRMFSRDLPARRAENARFLSRVAPVVNGVRGARARRADTAHKYARCSCGAWCRVPRGVGRVELTCPKCGRKKKLKA